MISSFGFAYALGFLIFGPLSDRLGRRLVMVGGLLALTVITIMLAAVQAPALVIAGRVLQGLAAASFPPVAIAYLAERGTLPQRGWSVAWMSTAFLSAGLLGQIYGEVVVTRWGLGSAFLPLCGVYVLTAWQFCGEHLQTRLAQRHCRVFGAAMALWVAFWQIQDCDVYTFQHFCC